MTDYLSHRGRLRTRLGTWLLILYHHLLLLRGLDHVLSSSNGAHRLPNLGSLSWFSGDNVIIVDDQLAPVLSVLILRHLNPIRRTLAIRDWLEQL